MYVPEGLRPVVRRSKADALLTRDRILDAAEVEFERGGVSRTSLQQIARAAGVTRGAIYWHFQDKADLFNAMMSRVTLPLEMEIRRSGDESLQDPVAQIRGSFLAALQATSSDAQLRRVIEIALYKVEHGGELQGVRERRRLGLSERVKQVEQGFRRAARRTPFAGGVPARHAAIGLHALVDGLIHHWMLDPGAFDLTRVGQEAVDAFLRGLRCADQATT